MGRHVQIRNVPEEVHAILRTRAAAAGMSLSEFLLAELVRVAQRPPVGDVLERAATRRAGVPVDQVVAAVRSGRDR